MARFSAAAKLTHAQYGSIRCPAGAVTRKKQAHGAGGEPSADGSGREARGHKRHQHQDLTGGTAHSRPFRLGCVRS